MFISFFNTAVRPPDVRLALNKFYMDSFKALYNITDDIEAEAADLEFPLMVLRKTISEKIGDKPKYFFDIRTTEEFGNPAPEYLLLYKLGLNNTVPLSIKGMGNLAIIQGFAFAELCLNGNETALFYIAEAYNRFDQKKYKAQSSGSFIVSANNGEMRIEKYGFTDDIRAVIQSGSFDHIWTDDPDSDKFADVADFGLTGLFPGNEMMKNTSEFRTLTILRHKDKYGFFIIGKENK